MPRIPSSALLLAVAAGLGVPALGSIPIRLTAPPTAPPPPCFDTPLLEATIITAAEPHIPDPWVPSATAAECQQACCGADLCVAWTFGDDECSLYTERGVLGRAPPGPGGAPPFVTAYRAMSVPPDASWPASWDTIPMYTHSSNASGLYSPTALANLTAGFPVIGLDWEVGFYPTMAHHLRQQTTAQARAIVAAKPTAKVLVYQQGFLALNFSDAEAAAIANRSRDHWWIHNADGSVYTWDDGAPAHCAWGVHCARVMNASMAELRQWYVNEVALPTLAEEGVAGLFVDNSMQLGMPWPSQGAPWHSLALQRGSAQLHRQVGQAMLAQHPGKRALLSVLQIHFTDNQPPAPTPRCEVHPTACGFALSGGCDRQLTVYWVDTIAQTKAWVPTCDMCGLNICGAEPGMRNLTCAQLDALANVSTFDCSMLPGAAPPGPPKLMPEQELMTYWRDIPWSRYYDGATYPVCSWALTQSPTDCVRYVRNMQAEALAGVPVVAGTGSRLSEPLFRRALAMFLMAAEKHSSFGEMNGYVCTDPADPNAPPELPPGQTWTNTSCTWLWRPEFEYRLGAPLSWADWDGGFKFERRFEHLNVSLDCATGAANFSWDPPNPCSSSPIFYWPL